MKSDIAVSGMGSGVTLIWIWNEVIPWAFGVERDAWPAMPGEVGAMLAVSVMVVIDRIVGDR